MAMAMVVAVVMPLMAMPLRGSGLRRLRIESCFADGFQGRCKGFFTGVYPQGARTQLEAQ